MRGKNFKSTDCFSGETPPRIHAISDLFSFIPSKWLTNLRENLLLLDDYYIPTRYPDVVGSLPEGMPEKTDAGQAIATARLLLEEARKILS